MSAPSIPSTRPAAANDQFATGPWSPAAGGVDRQALATWRQATGTGLEVPNADGYWPVRRRGAQLAASGEVARRRGLTSDGLLGKLRMWPTLQKISCAAAVLPELPARDHSGIPVTQHQKAARQAVIRVPATLRTLRDRLVGSKRSMVDPGPVPKFPGTDQWPTGRGTRPRPVRSARGEVCQRHCHPGLVEQREVRQGPAALGHWRTR